MSSTAPIADSVLDWTKRFVQGDDTAYSLLYRKYAPLLYAWLKPRCLGILSADDVAQETWLRIWRSRESFQGDNFQAWLFKIARNCLVSEYRKKRPGQMPEEQDVIAQAQESNAETLSVLRDCLKHVGGEFVSVLQAQLDGRTTQEIAEQFQIQSGTVFSRGNRARQQLQECVKGKLS